MKCLACNGVDSVVVLAGNRYVCKCCGGTGKQPENDHRPWYRLTREFMHNGKAFSETIMAVKETVLGEDRELLWGHVPDGANGARIASVKYRSVDGDAGLVDAQQRVAAKFMLLHGV